MTDLIARPVEEQRQDEPVTGIHTATKGAIIVLALLLGVVAGWALYVNAGPSRAELEQVRWQQVVNFYEDRYQMLADAQAARDAAHWQEVINHYARQYELMADVSRAPAVDIRSADWPTYWEGVVDYYEQQWESRGE